MNWKFRAAVPIVAVALLVSACVPRLYRVSVQQGNVITQKMVDSLEPGMTREQVAFVMGEPVIRNPFNEDRWDYVYTLRVPGYVDDKARLTLFFVDDALSHFSGDFKPSEPEEEGESEGTDGDSAEDEVAAAEGEAADAEGDGTAEAEVGDSEEGAG